MIAKILPYLNGLVIALQRAVNWIMKILNIDLSKLGSTGGTSNFDMSYLADDAENTADGLEDADKNAKKLQRTILGFDQLNILSEKKDDEDELDSAAVTAGLEGALDDILSEYQKVWDEAFSNMENKAQEIADNIEKAFSGIFGTFSKAWEEKGKPVVEAFQFMLENVKGVLVDIGKTFHDLFTSDTGVELIESILELFRSIFTVIGTIAEVFRTAWDDGGGKALVEALFEMFTKINDLLATIGDSFSRMFSNGTGKEIIENILGIFEGIFKIIGNIAERIKEAWEEAGVGDSIIQGILDIFNDVLTTIHNIIDSTAEWAGKLDFTPLLESIDTLLKAIEPLTKNIGEGLEWFWNNVLLPIAGWTIQEAVPKFLDMLAASIKVLNEVIEALKPLGEWLWEEFLKPLGEWAGDTVISAMKTVTDLLDNFSSWISKHQETVQAFVTIVGTLGVGFVAVSKAIPLVTTVLGGLSSALGFIASPIGLAVAAAVGLVAALSDLWETSESFRSTVVRAFKKIKSSIVDAFEKAKETITPFIESIVNLGSSIYDFYVSSGLKSVVALFAELITTIAGSAIATIIDTIGTSFAGLMKILTGAVNILGGVLDVLTAIFTLDFDKAKKGFLTLGKGILQALEGIFDITIGIGLDIINGILQGILDGVKDIGGWLKEHVVDPFVNWFKKLFGIHSPSTVMAEQGKFIMEGLFNGISGMVDKVKELFTNIKDTIVGVWESVTEKTSEIWGGISDTVSGAWNDLTDWASEKFDAVKETVSGAWDEVSSKTKEIWDGVSKKASEVWDNLKNWAGEKFDDVKKSVTTAWDNVTSATTSTWDNVSKKASGVWDSLKINASSKFSEIKSSVSTAWDNISKKTTDVWDGAKIKVEGVWSNLKTTADTKFDNIKSKVLGAWKSISEDTPKSWSSVEKAVNSVIKSITDTVKDLPSKFLKYGKNIADGLSKGISGAVNSVKSGISNLASSVTDFFEDDMEIHSPSKVMAEEGEYVVAGLLKGMEGDEDTISEWSESVSERMKESFVDTEEWLNEKGIGVVEGFLTGIEEKWGNVEEWVQETSEKLKESGAELIEGFSNSVSEKWDEFSEWQNSSFSNTETSFSEFILRILEVEKESLSNMVLIGKEKMEVFSNVFLDKFHDLSSAAPMLYDIGRNLISSFIEGFQSMEVPTPDFDMSGNIGFSSIEIAPAPDLVKGFSGQMTSSKMLNSNFEDSGNYTNKSMTEEIKEAVIQGMMEVFMATRDSQNNQNAAPVVDFTFKVDPETLYKTVLKGKQKYDRRYNIASEF